MDFDQLATFVYVAKLKSFSRAGQKVFRSQSAVSAQIRQLEQAYRAKLLDRSAKSVELTPAGEVLFEFAERLLRLRDVSRSCTSVSIAISATKFCSASKMALSMWASSPCLPSRLISRCTIFIAT